MTDLNATVTQAPHDLEVAERVAALDAGVGARLPLRSLPEIRRCGQV